MKQIIIVEKMMQGRGLTNYDPSKPSHEYTTSTTQFDDELMKRGIINFEQVGGCKQSIKY